MVVANAVASLGEISTSARRNYLKLDEAFSGLGFRVEGLGFRFRV